jgi:hypothetical protein
MKTSFLFIALSTFYFAQSQQSSYYSVDVNQTVNSNENINISGNVSVNKNISTIDYGKLALANAENERNRLENLKYVDNKKRQISLDIAANPSKAFDYGYQNTFTVKGKDAKAYNFKKFTMSYRIPNETLFVSAGSGRFENVSSNDITTEILISAPYYNEENEDIDVEETGKLKNIQEGAFTTELDINGDKIFVHKKDLNRATVFGHKGFKTTIKWEDDYQYTITDNFTSFNKSEGNGVIYYIKVRTYGDKDYVTFEELEGRRYYLKRLIEKVISTAYVTDIKY